MTPLRPARIRHGERTRLEILGVAEELAAREGLEGLTIGRLADEVGMSKAGVFAHFGSKEALQLATIAAAFQRFSDEVAAPALEVQPGLDRLRASCELYFAYLERRLPAGGCFFSAAALEMDDRPGPVRDEVARFMRMRQAMIVQAIEEARARRQLERGADVGQLAFELTSLASGAVGELQMFKDAQTLARARAAIRGWLARVAKAPPPPRRARSR